MQVPLQISYRGVEKTPHLDDLIQEKVSKLEQVCDHIISCSVAIERPQVQRTGGPFRVRIDLRVPPGHEVFAENKPGASEALPSALRDAFNAARRQLKELNEKQHRDVKAHPEQAINGYIVRIFPRDGYGFIETLDGREVYFHRNSVLHGDFERIIVGTGVHFREESGVEGPQASSLHIVDKTGHALPPAPPGRKF